MLTKYDAYKSLFDVVFGVKKKEFGEDWVQLELDITPTECKHEFYDDDNDRGMGIFCHKCDYFSEVGFLNPYHDKTYQEVFDIMSKERRLKC